MKTLGACVSAMALLSGAAQAEISGNAVKIGVMNDQSGLYGHQLEADTSAVVKEEGGEVPGSVRHPLSTADFSFYLLEAQGSGAKVIGLANAGGDTTNAIKQANEFGITQAGRQLAGLLL